MKNYTITIRGVKLNNIIWQENVIAPSRKEAIKFVENELGFKDNLKFIIQ